MAGPNLSLLLSLMLDALSLAGIKAVNQIRISQSLSPLASRALFSPTLDPLQRTKNATLLRILRTKGINGVVGIETREARNLRTIGKERGLKIDRIRSYSIELLKSKVVSQADIVRSWAYAVIADSARLTVLNAIQKHTALDFGNLRNLPEASMMALLSECHEMVLNKIITDMERSQRAVNSSHPDGNFLEFLDHATWLVIEEMKRPIHPLQAYEALLSNVFPEIDRHQI